VWWGLDLKYKFNQMKNSTSTTLKNEIKSSTHDFILVGEIHGVEENAQIIKEIIELVAESRTDIHLAFEWTLDDVEVKNISVTPVHWTGVKFISKNFKFYLCAKAPSNNRLRE